MDLEKFWENKLTIDKEGLKNLTPFFLYRHMDQHNLFQKDKDLYVHDSILNKDIKVAEYKNAAIVDFSVLWMGFETTTGIKFIYDCCNKIGIPVVSFPDLCYNKPAEYGIINYDVKDLSYFKEKFNFSIYDKIEAHEHKGCIGVITDIDDDYFYVDGIGIANKIPKECCMEFIKI